MAHFIGEDTTFSRQFLPIHRGTVAATHVPSADEAAASLVAGSEELEIKHSISLRAHLRPF